MASDSQTFKTVATCTDKMQAEILAALLRDNDIMAGVFGGDSSYPSLSFAKPIEVKVNEADYELAKSILAAADKAE